MTSAGTVGVVPDEPMSLRAALAASKATPDGSATPLVIGLACGSTPLHLCTFVRAYALAARPQLAVEVRAGAYGDIVASTAQLREHPLDAVVVVLEWPDLDPRLSPRRVDAAVGLGEDDLTATVGQRLRLLENELRALSATCPVAVVLPSLPLPTAVTARSGRLGATEAALRAAVAGLAASLARHDQLRIVAGLPGVAHNLRAELASDLPHPVDVASAIARAAVGQLFAPAPKKGLITDLDDTLWRGLVGEVGADGVAWDLDSGAAPHALYQHLLGVLAERGTLLAVVSKNDVEPVAAALARNDLRLPAASLHPVLASWEPKSDAVATVLSAWNIAADDVVFVDDSPIELAEIAARHPAITTLRFPTNDPAAIEALLVEVRDLFWKDTTGSDDRLRAASLRSGAEFESAREQVGDQLAFLRTLAATIELADVDPDETRPYELVQKTNQFSLNGARHEPAQWRRKLAEGDRITIRATYQDRFGELGTVSVLSAVRDGQTLVVDIWVLSCRAFSRGVEHAMLAAALEHSGADRAQLVFEPTARNTAAARFVESIAPDDGHLVDHDTLLRCDMLGLHTVTGPAPAQEQGGPQ